MAKVSFKGRESAETLRARGRRLVRLSLVSKAGKSRVARGLPPRATAVRAAEAAFAAAETRPS